MQKQSVGEESKVQYVPCKRSQRLSLTMTDKMRKKSRKSHCRILMNLFANYGGK
jgi:hypothetical protein